MDENDKYYKELMDKFKNSMWYNIEHEGSVNRACSLLIGFIANQQMQINGLQKSIAELKTWKSVQEGKGKDE